MHNAKSIEDENEYEDEKDADIPAVSIISSS
jgi:hypothetical protein